MIYVIVTDGEHYRENALAGVSFTAPAAGELVEIREVAVIGMGRRGEDASKEGWTGFHDRNIATKRCIRRSPFTRSSESRVTC